MHVVPAVTGFHVSTVAASQSVVTYCITGALFFSTKLYIFFNIIYETVHIWERPTSCTYRQVATLFTFPFQNIYCFILEVSLIFNKNRNAKCPHWLPPSCLYLINHYVYFIHQLLIYSFHDKVLPYLEHQRQFFPVLRRCNTESLSQSHYLVVHITFRHNVPCSHDYVSWRDENTQAHYTDDEMSCSQHYVCH